MRARPAEGGGSWVVAPLVEGREATALGQRVLGMGEAVDVIVRAARARREYIEGMLIDVCI